MYSEIESCRICSNKNLIPILHLGEQYLTGIFPKKVDKNLTKGPLELVKCSTTSDESCCGLVQLKHNYDLEEMYGETYGYRSGLNQSMVKHLESKINKILNIVEVQENDLIIDIGSNDATLLKAYPKDLNLTLIGIDPSAEKFRGYYPEWIELITEFFPSKFLDNRLSDKKARVITSIAMFYDLEEPMKFVQAVYDTLDDQGVWIFEQSYLPSMLDTLSYDTICHEHLEYYTVHQIKWMMDRIGFKIVDIELNNINGGSFSCTVAKKESNNFEENTELVNHFLNEEMETGLNQMKIYHEFTDKVKKHKTELVQLLRKLKEDGKTVYGYGASTKGNVLLQYCEITSELLPFIAEINEDKFNSYTPGTKIPIRSENELRALKPDYFMVLPWHFKENILQREKRYMDEGGHFLFPLPEIQIY